MSTSFATSADNRGGTVNNVNGNQYYSVNAHQHYNVFNIYMFHGAPEPSETPQHESTSERAAHSDLTEVRGGGAGGQVRDNMVSSR